jgi:hypothetical protein
MMKQNGILLASILLLMAAMASAQTQRVTVSVPFSFVAGHQTLPAGQYTIEQNRGQGSAILRSGKGRGTILSAAKSDREFEEKSLCAVPAKWHALLSSRSMERRRAGQVFGRGALERELASKQRTGQVERVEARLSAQ